MTSARIAKSNLRLDIRDVGEKQTDFEKTAVGLGNLSPNLQPATPPTFPNSKEPLTATKIGDKYLLLNRLEGGILRRCIHIESQQEYVCKVVKNERYRNVLRGHFRLDSHPRINPIVEVLVGKANTYIVFQRCYGDLHSYVRFKKNLPEREALPLFRQVASAVRACHSAGAREPFLTREMPTPRRTDARHSHLSSGGATAQTLGDVLWAGICDSHFWGPKIRYPFLTRGIDILSESSQREIYLNESHL
ncbi:tribbles 2 [Caerostris extrusa]|uniref:Tribbles 2 n=1 Tax=Caerostris extrusa TaxID=172846 RepID=A0AAV4XUF4_CAEEX|nr:tribbles 2 [Caerostris extrusa]